MRTLNEKGQTSVEYLLMLVVVLAISITFLTRVQSFVLGDGECNAGSTALICKYESSFGLGGNLRYFPITI